MRNRSGEKIKLSGIDELLGVVNEESAMEIDIASIHPFAGHPFKVIDDDKMQDLVESVRENGVITPVLIRPAMENQYEMISGHRRMHAAKLAGLSNIPAIVREMTDDEAVIAMVDANIQREELLPSEKAFAYKMKLSAMKRQAGRPGKNNSSPNGTNLRSDQVLAEEVGISRNQIQRYIRLTELIPELLNLVDDKKLQFTVAVEISYIDKEIQKWIYEYIRDNGFIKPMRNQFALYRVNPLTSGKVLWHKTFEEVREMGIPVRIELYRPYHLELLEKEEPVMEIWKQIENSAEVSDVLVLNQKGEISCFYINPDYPRRITGFLQIQTSGTIITLDTRDYEIEGYSGKWTTADDIIIDGQQFFLMEHQQFRRQAAMIVLDSYGKKVIEDCKNGFDREIKEKLYRYIHESDSSIQKEQLRRLEFWRRFFENGTYERSWESGIEVNYDGIDGCVNHQKLDPGKSLKEIPEKPKKRRSVIRRLRKKQIEIAKKSGKPIPRYLEQQMVREKAQ